MARAFVHPASVFGIGGTPTCGGPLTTSLPTPWPLRTSPQMMASRNHQGQRYSRAVGKSGAALKKPLSLARWYDPSG